MEDINGRQLAVIPLGAGLYKIANDIVCSYPLKGVEMHLSQHYIRYVYDPYDVRVYWDEEVEGVRTNPRWQREWKI